MAADYTTAVDEIYGTFKTAWDANAGAFSGGVVPEVRYDGIGEQGPPDGEAAYARIAIRHSGSEQATLGGSGTRRYTHRGIIGVQLFYPLKSGGGPAGNSGELAKVARAAFEGTETENHVWFRNAVIIEVGADGAYYHHNVFAEFEYDEFA